MAAVAWALDVVITGARERRLNRLPESPRSGRVRGGCDGLSDGLRRGRRPRALQWTAVLADQLGCRAHGFDLLLAEAAVQAAEGDVRVAAATPNPMISAATGFALSN